MATVSTIDQQIAEQYWKTTAPNSVLAVQYDAGWFGSKIAKRVGKIASGAAKAVYKANPIVRVATAASDIAHGKNVLKVAGGMVKDQISQLKAAAPYVQTVASFVPGAGTLASMGIGGISAGLQGKSLADIAKAVGTGAIPGGPLVTAVAMTAANAALAGIQGQNIAKAAAREIASQAAGQIPVPGAREVLVSAVNAAASGQNVLKGAKAGAIQAALAQVPDPSARAAVQAALSGKSPKDIISAAGGPLVAKAAAVAGNAATASLVQSVQLAASKMPQKVSAMQKPSLVPVLRSQKPSLPVRGSQPVAFARALPRTTLANRLALVAHAPVTNRARVFLKTAGTIARDTSGLTPDGKWLVQKGDTGSSIAKALTGNANRWTELKAVNPQVMAKASKADVQRYGFPMPYAGSVINLPASWVKAVQQSVPQVAPVVVPSATPAFQPTPAQVITTVLAPAGDTAAQLQARVMLAAWGKTDGVNAAGLQDYGGPSELSATGWSARDVLMAASFENWWNRSYRPGAPFLNTSGAWSQDLNDGLHAWTEAKAAQVLPGATVATTTAAPAPTVQTSTIPADNGTPAIVLPGITVTATAGKPQQPTAQAKEPSGIAKFVQENNRALVPAAVGLAVSWGSKFI